MSLPTAYLNVFKNAGDILQAIQAAQAPPRFTQKFLEGLGFPSSNDRTMINVLKSLGFLDDSGVPTRRYHEYLDQTQSALVLAEGLRDAYSDLFRLNKAANTMSQSEVKGKMKTLSEGQFTDRVLTQMAGTFTTLAKLADFAGVLSESQDQGAADVEAVSEQSPPDHKDPVQARPHKPSIGGLVYNINIHLPESRDPAVYDALFRALREHLG
ncbi:DUF5343 domain-containing protein [Salinibacterium sp. ZJ77]|uniref:DUF5343 domain-containing protein n=1 Tax=Salinibacterium sp. ZJ77 TaxID=2708337 RepID=UPI00142024F0|nr:DUF5343 domain-containing protein [Salinibacterium sp. ZJ77]